MAEKNDVQRWCVQFTACLPSICFHLHPSWSVSEEPKEEHERLPVFTITYGFWQNDNKLGAGLRVSISSWVLKTQLCGNEAIPDCVEVIPASLGQPTEPDFQLHWLSRFPCSSSNHILLQAAMLWGRWRGEQVERFHWSPHRDSTSTSEGRMGKKKSVLNLSDSWGRRISPSL